MGRRRSKNGASKPLDADEFSTKIIQMFKRLINNEETVTQTVTDETVTDISSIIIQNAMNSTQLVEKGFEFELR